MPRPILLGSNARSSIITKISKLYHWYALLAPSSNRKVNNNLGFLTVAGWQALTASGAFLCGTLIQGLIALTHPEYSPQRWHGTLLLWSVILVAVIVNTIISSLLPKLECLILIIHVLGFFAVLIPLVYMAPHGDAASVFTVFLNEGGWQTTGLSFMIGLTGNVFAFLGTSPSRASSLLQPVASNSSTVGTDAAIHVCLPSIFANSNRFV